jgi:hypothetical protein
MFDFQRGYGVLSYEHCGGFNRVYGDLSVIRWGQYITENMIIENIAALRAQTYSGV